MECWNGSIEDWTYQYSFKELRQEGLKLEPEELRTLWQEGEQLTEEELQLIGEKENKASTVWTLFFRSNVVQG